MFGNPIVGRVESVADDLERNPIFLRNAHPRVGHQGHMEVISLSDAKHLLFDRARVRIDKYVQQTTLLCVSPRFSSRQFSSIWLFDDNILPQVLAFPSPRPVPAGPKGGGTILLDVEGYAQSALEHIESSDGKLADVVREGGLRDAGTAAIASAVREVLRDMDPQLAPSEVVAISDLLWQSVAQPRFNTALLVILAICGALLAVIGTYGIVAYSVSQRAREIGLRMALGADPKATVAMIVRHALGIVLAGAVLGVIASLGATRFLSGQLIDVQPTDPLTYGVVLVAAVLVGLLAAWGPARRATLIDPIEALRNG